MVEGEFCSKEAITPLVPLIWCSVLIAITKLQHPTGAAAGGPRLQQRSIWWHTPHSQKASWAPGSPGEPQLPACPAARSRHMWPGAEAARGARRKAGGPQSIPCAQMFGKAGSGGPRSRAASPRCDRTRNVCKHHLAEVRCLLIAFKGRRDRLLVLAGSNG